MDESPRTNLKGKNNLPDFPVGYIHIGRGLKGKTPTPTDFIGYEGQSASIAELRPEWYIPLSAYQFNLVISVISHSLRFGIILQYSNNSGTGSTRLAAAGIVRTKNICRGCRAHAWAYYGISMLRTLGI